SLGLRAADIRHRRRLAECEGLSLRDAKRSARRRIRRNLRAIFQSARSSHELVGARAQGAQARNLRVHRYGKLPKRRKGLLRRAQHLQAQSAICALGQIARYATRSAKSCRARRWRGERLRGAITWGNEAVDRPQPAGYAPLPIGWGGLLPALRARRTIAFARAAGGPECFHQRCFSRSVARCSLPSPITSPPSTSKPAVERRRKWATARAWMRRFGNAWRPRTARVVSCTSHRRSSRWRCVSVFLPPPRPAATPATSKFSSVCRWGATRRRWKTPWGAAGRAIEMTQIMHVFVI